MAAIWKNRSDGFSPTPLQFTGGSAVDEIGEHCDDDTEALRIVAFRVGSKASHALLVGLRTDVRVNGWPVIGGIHVLDHKDEFSVGEHRMFFSAESQPVAERYRHDGSGRRPRCPVCRAAVEDEQEVVRCPGCSRVFHQIAATEDVSAKPCWTYATECRFCGHPTSMSGEPTWRPDEEQDQ